MQKERKINALKQSKNDEIKDARLDLDSQLKHLNNELGKVTDKWEEERESKIEFEKLFKAEERRRKETEKLLQEIKDGTNTKKINAKLKDLSITIEDKKESEQQKKELETMLEEMKKLKGEKKEVRMDKNIKKFNGSLKDNWDDWTFQIDTFQKFNNVEDKKILALVTPLLQGNLFFSTIHVYNLYL